MIYTVNVIPVLLLNLITSCFVDQIYFTFKIKIETVIAMLMVLKLKIKRIKI